MPSSVLVQRIVTQLQHRIQSGEVAVGSHMSAQKIADEFQVSRSPAREALVTLADQGLLDQQPNRGFFVLAPGQHASPALPCALEEPEAYYQLSEDWLNDRIPQDVTEPFVRERYGLSKAQASDILNRAATVGWAQPKPGYGWRFSEVAKTRQSLNQIYNLRLLIEPAGLLEPTFQNDPLMLRKLGSEQQQLLRAGIETLPADALLRTGMRFHEELMRMSGNSLYHMVLVQMNNMRRLIEYRAMVDRKRYYQQCEEHLQIIALVEQGDNQAASELMKRHLTGSLARKSPVLQQYAEAAVSPE
ncbi:GntR family transcriptional regulator [Pseudomonas caspiana]|uniref:GntR family transcriptional regulator n=1 Tax=Pseudomonas caspiana TaxID=1451454 RepID=UPI0032EB94DE